MFDYSLLFYFKSDDLDFRIVSTRALENGISISVAKVEHESIGVDTPEDIARVETILKSKSSLLK